MKCYEEENEVVRMGIALLSDLFPPEEIVMYAKMSETMGYESVWIPEHYPLNDAFSILGAIARETEKIGLATGVVNPYTRHPLLIAMAIATIDRLSHGRAILGIGTGVLDWIERQMKIGKVKKPLSAMKDAIYIIRKLINGEETTHNGNIFSVENVKLGIVTPQTKIPIYMAAVGPRMLQLAGEIADGTLFTAGSSLRYIRWAIENVKIGAERAERSISEVDTASFILCSISENREAARDQTRRLVAPLMLRPGRAKLMLEEEDFDEKSLNLMVKEIAKGNIHEACKYVTDRMIDSVTVSGTPEECRRKLQKYRDAGVSLPIVMPVNQNIPFTIKLFSEYFKL